MIKKNFDKKQGTKSKTSPKSKAQSKNAKLKSLKASLIEQVQTGGYPCRIIDCE